MTTLVVRFLVAWAVGEVRALPVFPGTWFLFVIIVRASDDSFRIAEAAVAKAVLVATQYVDSCHRGFPPLVVVAVL